MPTNAFATAGLGLRAGKGGAVAVGVAIVQGQPRIVFSSFIATCAEGDRLAREPYGIAAEMLSATPDAMAQATAAVAEGRARQDRLALDGLEAAIDRLKRAGHESVIVALLVNRAGWITDLLAYSRAWAEHVPVAEGLAVREAFRTAARHCAIALVEMDEKALPTAARAALALSEPEIDAQLKSLGVAAGKPWRKDQKAACLAAWTAIAARP